MLIRTMKEYNQHVKPGTTCHECGSRFLAPPVLLVRDRAYHLKCAINLAYGILFELTGNPEEGSTPPDI